MPRAGGSIALGAVNGCDEAVATARQSFYITGRIGGVAECFAQALYGVVDALVEFNESI